MVAALANELNIHNLSELIRTYLFGQLFPDDNRDPANVSLLECPGYQGKISVYSSASSTFYAPSDLSGTGGMRREYIRATPTWRQEGPRYDCVFVITNPELEGMCGMDIARVLCFFSFKTQRNHCRAGWLTVHTTVLCFRFNSPTLCPPVPYHYP